MRLLHITATHLNQAGGIPVVLEELVNAQNSIDGFYARVLSAKADTAEINSCYFDWLAGTDFDEYIEAFDPDVVIFHSHYYFEYIKLYRTLLKKRIPYYIEPHGSFGKAALLKSKHKKRIANMLVFCSYMKHANGFIFLNEREKQDAQFRTGNDLVIPNGIKKSEIKKNVAFTEPWFFYYIGRFDMNHKGLDYLFDALDLLEDEGIKISFRFYGTGTDAEVDYINLRISKYKLLDVINCGPIYGIDQLETLEQCGIMVLTSRYEGFPMTVLEAWKYGNPCLVTEGTNVSDEIEKYKLGWKTKLNCYSIKNSIISAKDHYLLDRKQYVIRCKEYVSDNYSWDHIAELSLKLLNGNDIGSQ